MRSVTAILAVTLLAACGRVGPPHPPGPVERITFPRQYPAPDRIPAAAPAETPTTPTAPAR